MFRLFAMMRRWLGGEDASSAGARRVRTRVWREGKEWIVDVRGQSCPGYLLEIDRAVARIGPGARIHLLIPECIKYTKNHAEAPRPQLGPQIVENKGLGGSAEQSHRSVFARIGMK